MSIKSLTTMAVRRDVEPAPTRQRVNKGTGQPVATLTTYQDALVDAIPTEVLSGYTVLVGITVSTIKATAEDPNPSQLLALRWVFFAGFLLATAGLVWGAYALKRATHRRRRIPVPEMLAATMAAAAWGLVMPGNPLSPALSPQAATIAAAAISIAGAGLVGACTALLVRGSNATAAAAGGVASKTGGRRAKEATDASATEPTDATEAQATEPADADGARPDPVG